MASVLIRERTEKTQTWRRPYEGGDRDESCAVISQGISRATRKWKRQGRILPFGVNAALRHPEL